MAKNGVEGVYTRRPARSTPTPSSSPRSRTWRRSQRRLRVMDSTALTLCMENRLPIYVFNMDDEQQHRPDSVRRAGGNAGRDDLA